MHIANISKHGKYTASCLDVESARARQRIIVCNSISLFELHWFKLARVKIPLTQIDGADKIRITVRFWLNDLSAQTLPPGDGNSESSPDVQRVDGSHQIESRMHVSECLVQCFVTVSIMSTQVRVNVFYLFVPSFCIIRAFCDPCEHCENMRSKKWFLWTTCCYIITFFGQHKLNTLTC